MSVVLPGRPKRTRWWYFPGPPIHSWAFVRHLRGIGVRTGSGYFVTFARRVVVHLVTMRTLCPVPLTHSRFKRLMATAFARDHERDDTYDDYSFRPLRIKDTLHYREMQRTGRHY